MDNNLIRDSDGDFGVYYFSVSKELKRLKIRTFVNEPEFGVVPIEMDVKIGIGN